MPAQTPVPEGANLFVLPATVTSTTVAQLQAAVDAAKASNAVALVLDASAVTAVQVQGASGLRALCKSVRVPGFTLHLYGAPQLMVDRIHAIENISDLFDSIGP